ncbi:hypothetical protein WA026_021634 [Henosepilachna vigintioctopunctata]|uniref:Uncharacterized protein n=1 Tax=Henosepilachna vigintioctopunctata TaxID=420089 RepID=A0AAW1V5D7_9CUCU
MLDLPSTIPGPAEPYTGRRRKRSRFFKSFPSLLQVPPPRNRHTCHLQDKPLDPRQTHLPEEFACWFWSGGGILFSTYPLAEASEHSSIRHLRTRPVGDQHQLPWEPNLT